MRGLRDFSTGDPAVAAEVERSIIATALALAAAADRRIAVATEDVPRVWAELVLADAVRIALGDGGSWIQVGEALGITPAEARERFAVPGV